MRTKADKWLEEDGLLRLEAWARDGLTLGDIAKNIGIAESTLRIWKDKHQTISGALMRGREVADIIVENALHKSATGFTKTVKKIVYKNGEPTQLEDEFYYPPNFHSIRFWLANRQKERWRDRPDVTAEETLKKLDEVLGKIGGNI